MTPAERMEALWASRPRSLFLRVSLVVLAGLMILSWGFGDLDWSGLFSPRRAANLRRFMAEIRPFPVQGVRFVQDFHASVFQPAPHLRGKLDVSDRLPASFGLRRPDAFELFRLDVRRATV